MKKIYMFIVLALVPLLTMCSGPYGPMMGGWDRTGNYGCPFGFGYGYGGMFMGIIFLIIIALLIYYFVPARKTKGLSPTQGESNLDILKKRYAMGEIAKEEYERIKKDLEG
jgi:putative membrane protein